MFLNVLLSGSVRIENKGVLLDSFRALLVKYVSVLFALTYLLATFEFRFGLGNIATL